MSRRPEDFAHWWQSFCEHLERHHGVVGPRDRELHRLSFYSGAAALFTVMATGDADYVDRVCKELGCTIARGLLERGR